MTFSFFLFNIIPIMELCNIFASCFLTRCFIFKLTIIMKTVLKTGEIIERLKKILKVQTLEICYISTLDLKRFYRVYVLMIHYGDVYQALSITLQYGWIEVEFGEVGKSFSDIQYCYFSFLTEIPFFEMKQDIHK